MSRSSLSPSLLLLGAATVGCIDHSPYDATVCRTSTFERISLEGGEIARDRRVSPLDGDEADADVGRCTEVDELRIEGSGGSDRLRRLANLTEVGRLSVGPTDELFTLDGLGALEVIRGDLELVDNASLASLAALSSLRSVGGGWVVEDNPALSQCDVESRLAQLQGTPALLSVGGIEPCPDPEPGFVDLGDGVEDLILLGGVSRVLDVEAATAERVLVVGRSGPAVQILDPERNELATTSTPALSAQGVAMILGPDGRLDWSVFVRGNWPIGFDGGSALAFAQVGSRPSLAMYAGWVSNEAQIGDRAVEEEGLWYGTVSSAGASVPASAPLGGVVSQPEVLAAAAADLDDLWVLLREGEGTFASLTLVRLDPLGEEPAVALAVAGGPLAVDGLEAHAGGRVTLRGRRSEPGNVAIGVQPAAFEGDFGFVVQASRRAGPDGPVVEIDAQDALATSDGGTGTRAPDCIAVEADALGVALGADLAGDIPVAIVDPVFSDELGARIGNVGGRPLLGLPFDRPLSCRVLDDGRLMVSGLGSFTRGRPTSDSGWRVSYVEPDAAPPRVQEVTVGRLRGLLDEIQSVLTPDGVALLLGPLPSSLRFGSTELVGRAGQPETFLAARRGFFRIP